ncbi:1,2-phenylacetyl-CoA epoxidase subunit PaaD [Marinobacterium jannaschii]|uniref:1,2-phenylacetyl-CoA epoxidase subunit PaaD n=1 Tax=Marinobacterium jannaschii TaxID=64970 RepID=UPI0004851F38|nr:1,2-phenylacetyl-CoA epoxidase subunit PaaD [Marinobacterium jannaschii]
MQRIPLISQEQQQRIALRNQPDTTRLWQILDAVKDPEIPALSIWDLGVLQDIEVSNDGVLVIITPTYSGCPAMDTIADDIRAALAAAAISPVRVRTRLAPAWTTDWLSAKGREQLRSYGIAPPEQSGADELTPDSGISCPHCGSVQTRRISEFGSTACKALFRCNDCSEPFDYFKKI